MCEPVSIGLAVAATGASMLSSRSAAGAARSTQNAQNEVFRQNRAVSVKQAEERRARENRTIERSNKAYAKQIIRSEEKITQLKASTAEDALTARAAFIEARGSVLAAAGSAGGGGLSIQDQMRSFAFKQGRAVSIRGRNLEIQINSVVDNMEDLHAQAVSRADQVTPAPWLANGLIQAPEPNQALSDLNSIIGGASIGLAASSALTPKPPAAITPTTGFQTGGSLSSSSGLQLGPGTFT